MADSAALWKLGHFLPILSGLRGPFSSIYSILWPPIQLFPSLPANVDARSSLSFSLKHAPSPFLAVCHPGRAAPTAGQVSSSLAPCRKLLAEPFLLFSLHSIILKARWNPNPIRSVQCEGFSHGFLFLGRVWRVWKGFWWFSFIKIVSKVFHTQSFKSIARVSYIYFLDCDSEIVMMDRHFWK